MNDTMTKEKIGVAMARRLEYANAPLPGLGKRKPKYYMVTLQLGRDEYEMCARAAQAARAAGVTTFCARAIREAVKDMAAQMQFCEREQELARARKAGFKV